MFYRVCRLKEKKSCLSFCLLVFQWSCKRPLSYLSRCLIFTSLFLNWTHPSISEAHPCCMPIGTVWVGELDRVQQSPSDACIPEAGLSLAVGPGGYKWGAGGVPRCGLCRWSGQVRRSGGGLGLGCLAFGWRRSGVRSSQQGRRAPGKSRKPFVGKGEKECVLYEIYGYRT